MGGPKRIILAIGLLLLAAAAVLSIWLASLKPEVRQLIFREVFGLSESVTQTVTVERATAFKISVVQNPPVTACGGASPL